MNTVAFFDPNVAPPWMSIALGEVGVSTYCPMAAVLGYCCPTARRERKPQP